MKYLNFGLGILFIFLLLFPFLFLPRIIRIGKIECRSQYGPCLEKIKEFIGSSLGKTIIETKRELSSFFRQDKIVQEFSFQYKIPQTLRVDLVLRKAKYALKSSQAEKIFLIAEDGEVVGETNETNLPLLISDQSDNLFALELLYRLYYLYQIKTGEIKSDSLIVYFPGNLKVIFPLGGDPDVLLGSLKLVLSRLNEATVKSKIIRALEIDLRFKNPIIR